MAMASSTITGHADRALDFYNNQNLYFGIGKTTSWSSDSTPTSSELNNDENPPKPTSEDTLQEIIGYKKVERKFLVYPDPTGEITCAGRTWKIVKDPTKVYELGARWVYLDSTLRYDELPTEYSFRQVGVFSKLIRSSSALPGQTALLPSEVEDPGILQAIYHRKPVYRDAHQRELLTTILTF